MQHSLKNLFSWNWNPYIHNTVWYIKSRFEIPNITYAQYVVTSPPFSHEILIYYFWCKFLGLDLVHEGTYNGNNEKISNTVLSTVFGPQEVVLSLQLKSINNRLNSELNMFSVAAKLHSEQTA